MCFVVKAKAHSIKTSRVYPIVIACHKVNGRRRACCTFGTRSKSTKVSLLSMLICHSMFYCDVCE